ncbi:MAG: amino acid permease [Longimicrobiales bacterium]
MATASPQEKLSKELKLFDVFAISTGAMFSSGFFLLPGVAAAYSGPAVVLSYLVAGLLVVPALLCLAELCTAMPRAGGAYYFLDRSLGPVFGTVGGLGTWVAQVFKSAFALVGIGAYLTLLTDVPMKSVTVALTVAFVLLNILGAKETTGLQKILVAFLVAVVSGFVLLGAWRFVSLGPGEIVGRQFTPFMPFGVEGLLSTVGLVFVSYAGLTKVAGIAEEVQNADRNIPLGMILSLITATALYVAGVFVMVAVLDPSEFRDDLTPVATATSAILGGVSGLVALILVVGAAFAAFASTANAGIMSASRYLLAMARDRHVWPGFAELNRFRTPTAALLATGGAMVFSILAFDVESVAKLASAFLLLVFSLVNLAVIVMRESGIEGYEPGFRSPFYPWVQIVGFLAPFVLIAQMGWLAILFVAGVTGASLVWYHVYVRQHTQREGAVFHLFERLGRQRDPGLDRELREILKETGSPEEHDPFIGLVTESTVFDLDEPTEYESVVWRVSTHLAAELGNSAEDIAEKFLGESRMGFTPVAQGVALPHLRVAGIRTPHLVMVRAADPIGIGTEEHEDHGETAAVRALFFLVSPEERARLHLSLLASLAGRVCEEGFLQEWIAADDEQELKEAVLHDERFLSLLVREGQPSGDLIDMEVRDITFDQGALIALVHRDGAVVIPRGRTRLARGDRLTVIGEPEAIRRLRTRFGT